MSWINDIDIKARLFWFKILFIRLDHRKESQRSFCFISLKLYHMYSCYQVSEFERLPLTNFNRFMGKLALEDWTGNATTHYCVEFLSSTQSIYNLINRALGKSGQWRHCTTMPCPVGEQWWISSLYSVPKLSALVCGYGSGRKRSYCVIPKREQIFFFLFA